MAATTAPKREASSRSSGSPLPEAESPWFGAALRLLIALVLNAARAEKEGYAIDSVKDLRLSTHVSMLAL
uniref:Uncharacterized protein n=1 Tax=Sphaerodactylus townsendi TaxID=933632 RepID=A0ACB8FIR2_9SAUR